MTAGCWRDRHMSNLFPLVILMTQVPITILRFSLFPWRFTDVLHRAAGEDEDSALPSVQSPDLRAIFRIYRNHLLAVSPPSSGLHLRTGREVDLLVHVDSLHQPVNPEQFRANFFSFSPPVYFESDHGNVYTIINFLLQIHCFYYSSNHPKNREW